MNERDFDFDEYPQDPSLRRRDFLKLLGLTGGILVTFEFGEGLALQERERRFGRSYPEDFNAYVLISPNGRVACYTGKIEMGQGVITSLAQMAAGELDVALDAVDMVMGDTDLCPWDAGTFGSLTTRAFGPALRAAAAEARAVLVELAAEKLKVPKDRLATKDGVVFDAKNPETKVTYGELANGRKIQRHLAAKPPLKPVADWTVMGRPELHRDARRKVTGGAAFAGDVRMEGMLYARILFPPAHGATLASLDTSQAEKVPGARVVRDGDLVAALHQLPDVAGKALAAIKAQWDVPASDLNERTIFEHLLKSARPGQVAAEGGNLAEGEAKAAVLFDETYYNAYVAHAPMETHTSVADVRGERATVWASTQAPFRVKDDVAQALGVPPDNVHVLTPFVGGGFGGKNFNLQSAQAARLSKAVGRPVQVMWTRGDEFFNDTFRPAAVVKIKSRSSTPTSSRASSAGEARPTRSGRAPGEGPAPTPTTSPASARSTSWPPRPRWTRSSSGSGTSTIRGW